MQLARFAVGVAVGALAETLLGIPMSPVFASPLAGALAGYLAGPPPHRGALAGFIASLGGVAALAGLMVYIGSLLAGLPGALLAGAPASGLLLVGAASSFFAAVAGAAGAGLRAARSR